jgi:hypothetical protein
MNRFLPFQVLFIAAAAAVAVIIAVAVYDSPAAESPAGNSGGLHVSQDGGQTQTNVPGSQLQQGAAPENSGASSDQTPQQAQPNYCSDGEVPVVDGCVAR